MKQSNDFFFGRGEQFLKLSYMADGTTSDNRFTILKLLINHLRQKQAEAHVSMRLVMKQCAVIVAFNLAIIITWISTRLAFCH